MKRWLTACLAAMLVIVPAWANIGRVKNASGGARIERGAQRIVAAPGIVLEKGDVIITPPKARMGITFIDNARLAIGPNSRVVIRAFDFDDTTHKGSFVAEVTKGQVGIIGGQISKSGKTAMQVRTPKSVFAVRGARIVVTVK